MKRYKKLGDKGESFATFYLLRRGYSVLAENYHAPGGEIDIVAEKGGVFVFIEVKTRTNQADQFGGLQHSITIQKLRRIEHAIGHYFLHYIGIDQIPHYQIDALLIQFDQGKFFCEHKENISYEDFS